MNLTNILAEAKTFINICYQELASSEQIIEKRLLMIEEEIRKTGMFTHTYEELAHGARMAWRNSNRCIGRLFWESMHVLDKRKLETEEEIANALFFHLRYGTNGGRVIPTINIFQPRQVRIWNHQLIR